MAPNCVERSVGMRKTWRGLVDSRSGLIISGHGLVDIRRGLIINEINRFRFAFG
jgi:hypothetical protein